MSDSAIDHALMDFDSYASINGVKEIADARQYMETVLAFWVDNQAILYAQQLSQPALRLLSEPLFHPEK